MHKFTTIVAIIATALCSATYGQPPRVLQGNKSGGDAMANKKLLSKDFEGVIWEFKVIDPKTRKTESVGRFRIKQDALFLVRMKEVGNKEAPTNEKAEVSRRGPLAQTKVAANTIDPSERIGEVDHEYYTEANQVRLNFDTDDKYELSGRAYIKRTSSKSTIWEGYYDDDNKKRWKFELRKIEE